MTQDELAKAIGVGVRTLRGWELDQTVPRNRMGMLEEFFGVRDANSPLAKYPDSALAAELLNRALEREHRTGTG